jgi:hypothetical protein
MEVIAFHRRLAVRLILPPSLRDVEEHGLSPDYERASGDGF